MRIALKLLLVTAACMICVAAEPVSVTAGVFCGDRISSGAASGADKKAASDAAVSWWASRAGALGRGYEKWDAAKDKTVTCFAGDNGGFSCTASAKPCLPDGTIPDAGKRIEL